MPLQHSSSKKARQANIKAEIDAGKPVRQAVAIGYSVQRRAEGSRSKLDRDKVSRWQKGERRDYR